MMTVHCRSDFATAIKSALTMEEVAIQYGFEPNRAHFINCPFHQERTASCKIYPDQGGFFCHSCNRGGSVIDFTMLLFNLPFRDACARLNADFGLGLPMDKPSRAEMSRMVRQRQAEARRREERKQKELALFDRECYLTAEINQAEIAMKESPPTRDGWDATYPAEWVEAVKRLDELRWELWRNDCEQVKMRNGDKADSVQQHLHGPGYLGRAKDSNAAGGEAGAYYGSKEH